jgi:hypothetical protein
MMTFLKRFLSRDQQETTVDNKHDYFTPVSHTRTGVIVVDMQQCMLHVVINKPQEKLKSSVCFGTIILTCDF